MARGYSAAGFRVMSALVLAGAFAVLRAEQAPTRFGHRAYATAPRSSLAEAGRGRAGRVVRLRGPAAEAFQGMRAAAKQAGHDLIPISGFRTREYQEGLFKRSVKRRGSERKAAEWVAPPGYSEHHTGWTLDLGDGAAPETDVDPSFERTDLFRWLSQNAARFGFELSFPKGNPQGVGYEPWHWRFVGNDEARRLFHPE